MKKLLTNFYLRKLSYEFFIFSLLCVWRRKDVFLETGAHTTAYDIKLTFLNLVVGFISQRGVLLWKV
jgi:hypothetical protein